MSYILLNVFFLGGGGLGELHTSNVILGFSPGTSVGPQVPKFKTYALT